MNLVRFGLIGALASVLALPVMAQTATTPAKPTPTLTKPVPATTPALATAPPAATAPAATTPAATTPVATTPAATTPAAAKPASASTLVDINSASPEDLDKLPGIGKSRATAIVKNRPYKGKDDLVDRKIVPANVYKNIKDKIIAKQG
jgi:DNA uptake protein ComE-like DNA-binding protein